MRRSAKRTVPNYVIALIVLSAFMITLYGMLITRLEHARYYTFINESIGQQVEVTYRIIAKGERLSGSENLRVPFSNRSVRNELETDVRLLQSRLSTLLEGIRHTQIHGTMPLADRFFAEDHATSTFTRDIGLLMNGMEEFTTLTDTLLAATDDATLSQVLKRMSALRDWQLSPVIQRTRTAASGEIRAAHRLALTIDSVNVGITLFMLFLMGRYFFGPLANRVTEQEDHISKVEAEIERSTNRDPITGLPNERALLRHLEALLTPGSSGSSLAILIHFQTLTHSRLLLDGTFTSDLLNVLAERLQQNGHAGQYLAHLGQGQFILLRDNEVQATDIPGCITRLEEDFATPIAVKAHRIQVRLSTGFYCPDGSETPDEVLANVQAAQDSAFRSSDSRHQRFAPEMHVRRREQKTLAQELKKGLENGELRAHFQPQANLRTGRITGFEALVRWYHPTRGFLSPGLFLPLAEELGLDDLLGEAMLEQGIRALRSWDEQGHNIAQLGLNFSRTQLQNRKLPDILKWALERDSITPDRIAVEVLENIHVEDDNDPIVRNVRALSAAGFRIDLDDFGTGSASITGLRRFHAHRIKIDRSFIADIDKRSDNQQMVSIMLHMARNLGLEVLAEGVETEAEIAALRSIGCYSIQGYVLAKPMPFEETGDWLHTYRAQSGNSRGPRSVAV
ncbi:putative bifunctional diguanylate cyclase/phosphodiesterase [Algicella marina]|uniref:EAL domain-containing protein n=1 Tax=Algicella marina TaxID=2683284 RepID=A0A6P1T2Y2_9RHOB|nr:GGDEF domain-containing phosphodiesterase [Algicella marina]QHQ35826.1 EAL domain-containing protein [Algicella marina]